MPKLHEILAVEGDLDATAKKVVEEATVTFVKKPDHFLEAHRTLSMFDEGRSQENTEESKALVTTVADKLSYVKGHVAKYLDTFAQKEATNQTAVADLTFEGAVFNKVPATCLLGLESKLKALRSMYEAIPTLQPGIDWALDPERGNNIYKAVELETRMKTEKQIQHKILVDPTDHHPAQVEKWTADVSVGKFTDRKWSGMMSPAEKSDLLGRLDTVIRAVKKARQRANTAEVVPVTIGKALLDYIHG